MNSQGSHRLKVLVLLPFAPNPEAPHGGGRVIAQFVTGLAKRHRVALVYLRAPHELPIASSIKECCEIVEEVVRPGIGATCQAIWARRLQLFVGLIRGRPMQATDWFVKDFAVRLHTIVQKWQPDIVQIEYQMMAQYHQALVECAALRVLTIYEPGTEVAREKGREYTGYTRWRAKLDMWAWQRFERRMLEHVNAVVVFTQQDEKAVLRVAPFASIARIPFGTVPLLNALNPLGHSPPSLVFVGSFVHSPNEDAALRLIQKIFPAVSVICPTTLLYIVGDQPSASLRSHATAQIIVTGFVPDVVPYLEQAAVVVVPLRLGGGMRVKVLEALAAGKAVVASSVAVAGLDVKHGEHLLIADTDTEFVDAVIDLLNHPERRAALATHARAWACSTLDPANTITAYEVLYEGLCDPEKSK